MKTTLFVAGFGPRTRARNLACEFERYGRLVRCDIPAPKSAKSRHFAFVEFEDTRDAEEAYNKMHGRRINGSPISWARNAPSARWRYDRTPSRRHSGPSRGGRSRSSRSPSPPAPSRYRSRFRSSPPPPPGVRRGEYSPDEIPALPPPLYVYYYDFTSSLPPFMPYQNSSSP
ncbi:hypothetical protein LRAMOSA04651 [Lichtheimia ramosa]|uniref:RRM domain-containing protein n=1 Tax=Lichtheimia ramosa TaxID=688394 RepID=A0A077X052_9FUNG|nr:hypothetical protein LRAMOSA04651 [Lichtheimia ramosa]